MCDWREPCDWPDAFLIDRSPEPPLTACLRHLGVVAFFPGVNWPLNLAWVGSIPLPRGLIPARIFGSNGNTGPAIICGVVDEDPFAPSDTGVAEPVDKTMEHG